MSSCGKLFALHQFDAIAKGIFDMHALTAIERNIGSHAAAIPFAPRDNFRETFHYQRRMRFFRGPESFLNSQMNFHCATFKPRAAALREFFRLRHFSESQHSPIKRARVVFAFGGIASCT